jgi:hypothetical protein
MWRLEPLLNGIAQDLPQSDQDFPQGAYIHFSGLTSRWMRPLACAWAMP